MAEDNRNNDMIFRRRRHFLKTTCCNNNKCNLFHKDKRRTICDDCNKYDNHLINITLIDKTERYICEDCNKLYKKKPSNFYARKRCDINKATAEFFEEYDEIDPVICKDKHKYYLDIAATVAVNSLMNHKHGAVIVHKKKIIATGYNYFFSQFSKNYSIHAEVAAINSLKGKMKDILPECELYIVRIGPTNYQDILKYSKPCFRCQDYINKHNIKKTYYSTNYNYDDITK